MGCVMPAVYGAMTQAYVERFTLAEIEQLNAGVQSCSALNTYSLAIPTPVKRLPA